jgi:hypothetical protein
MEEIKHGAYAVLLKYGERQSQFIGRLRCLGHEWILMAQLVVDKTIMVVGIFNSTIGALYRLAMWWPGVDVPLKVVQENPVLTNIILCFMILIYTIFQKD